VVVRTALLYRLLYASAEPEKASDAARACPGDLSPV
jgi:hypothetical protein